MLPEQPASGLPGAPEQAIVLCVRTALVRPPVPGPSSLARNELKYESRTTQLAWQWTEVVPPCTFDRSTVRLLPPTTACTPPPSISVSWIVTEAVPASGVLTVP